MINETQENRDIMQLVRCASGEYSSNYELFWLL